MTSSLKNRTQQGQIVHRGIDNKEQKTEKLTNKTKNTQQN